MKQFPASHIVLARLVPASSSFPPFPPSFRSITHRCFEDIRRLFVSPVLSSHSRWVTSNQTAHLRVPYTRSNNVCHHGALTGQLCPSTTTKVITTIIGPPWTCTSTCANTSRVMSASRLARSSASAGGILTNEECYNLLDIDIFNDDDLLKNFPSAAKSDYCFQDDVSASLYPPSPMETKPSPTELANDLLQQLETQCKQENIFPNWLEDKVDLFESIPHVGERVEPVLYPAPLPAPAPHAPHVGHTEELLREFETVYGVVELTHLTPPQSPPGPASQLLVSYAQQAQNTDPWPLAPAPAAAPSPDEYSWSHDVDELVRAGAAHLPSPHSSAQSSPASSPRSSATDEEWSSAGGGSTSRRPKPYTRHTDDRRSRKKEQNKNAATRYRQKKKAEVEVLLGEEATLRQRHTDLGDKCSDLQREIRYLKGLMRDLFKAKGLIK